MYCLHLQSRRVTSLNSGSNTFYRNVDTFLPGYISSHPRWQHFSRSIFSVFSSNEEKARKVVCVELGELHRSNLRLETHLAMVKQWQLWVVRKLWRYIQAAKYTRVGLGNLLVSSLEDSRAYDKLFFGKIYKVRFELPQGGLRLWS
jgi:hypothetical protein